MVRLPSTLSVMVRPDAVANKGSPVSAAATFDATISAVSSATIVVTATPPTVIVPVAAAGPKAIVCTSDVSGTTENSSSPAFSNAPELANVLVVLATDWVATVAVVPVEPVSTNVVSAMSASIRLYVTLTVPSPLSVTRRPSLDVTKASALIAAATLVAMVSLVSPAVTATVTPPTVMLPPPVAVPSAMVAADVLTAPLATTTVPSATA